MYFLARSKLCYYRTAEKDDKSEKKERITEEPSKKDTEIKHMPAPGVEKNFILPLESLVKHVTWTNNDAEYYLKEVRLKKILSTDNQILAMTQTLQAFVDLKKLIHEERKESEEKNSALKEMKLQNEKLSVLPFLEKLWNIFNLIF